MRQRLLAIFFLGFSSGLPLSLLSSTLQAWFASSNMSIMATGMLSLLGIPYAYKFLWAPLLDRYQMNILGKRRTWLLSTQILLLIGFNFLSWFSPVDSPLLMVICAVALAIISATQDVAVDAQRVEYLPVEFHGLGASIAVLGYRIALLISGGVALVLAHYLGFSWTYRIMALCMTIGVVTTFLTKEPSHQEMESLSLQQAYLAPLKELLSQRNILYLFAFIFFYKFGEAFTATTSGIVMPFLIQGLGFEIDVIGYINKMLGVSSIIVGGLLAGILLVRWSLYRALLVFGLLQAATNFLFVLLAHAGKDTMLLCIAVVSDNFATGMGSTAMVALLMRIVDRRFTASQMAILVAFSTLPRIISGPFAAMLQSVLGWEGMYQMIFILSFMFIPFLLKIKSTNIN